MTSGWTRLYGGVVAGTGSVLIVFFVLHATTSTDPFYWLLQAYPIALSAALAGLGVTLARGRLVADRSLRRLFSWMAASIFVSVLFLTWFYGLTVVFRGETPMDPPVGVVAVPTLGVLAGLLIGTYDARAREQQATVERLSQVTETLRIATSELVEQTDRHALERAVCDRLAEAEEYHSALVGRYDAVEGGIHSAAWAGFDDAVVESLVVPLDGVAEGDAWHRAVETRTVQFVQRRTADEPTPWRETLDRDGVESMAVVPIVGTDTVYGLICIYATERRAFGDYHREVFAELGETVGQAIESIRAQEALELREQELVAHNDRLDEFTGVVSHDLRNPLNVATMYLDLARRESDDDEHLDRIGEALGRMTRLIDDLLTLAQDGAIVDEFSDTDLRDIAEEAWDSVVTPTATLSFDDDLGSLSCDRRRTRQLLENLFRNSVEHAGPDVTVTVGRTDDGFYVADDGPGIPADQREAVFDVGSTTNENGTGFGLSIVQNIADAHGWTSSIDESSDGGVRFEFARSEPAPPN